MQLANRLARALYFFVDRVPEIALQALDFFGLLLQVVSKAHELVNDFALYLGSLVRFQVALAVEISQNVRCIGETTGFEKRRRQCSIIYYIRRRQVEF